MRNYLIILSFFIGSIFNIGASGRLTKINLQDISTKEFVKKDEDWFYKEFVRSYMPAYKDKTFLITDNNKPKIFTYADIKEKEQWLLDTAQEEWQNYIAAPKQGNKAFIILHNKQAVGALLYRYGEKTIYIAQYFILPEFCKKGIGYYVIDKLLPKFSSTCRYEVLARHQNDGAWLLYKKLGFAVGDMALVQKYGYDPLRYIGFFKIT